MKVYGDLVGDVTKRDTLISEYINYKMPVWE